MAVTKNRKNKLTPRQQAGGLTPEQKEFILNALVLRWPYAVIKEEFETQFGRKAPTPSVVSQYGTRYAEEIERRRAEWRADLKSSGILFVQQYERVGEYSRYARIEARRKRYKAAREHMHEIALETGDLKERREITGKDGKPIEVRFLTDADLDREIADRLAELSGSRHETAGHGAAAPDRPCEHQSA